MDKSDLAVRGAAAAPVTGAEVKRLILEAQAAWREQTRLALTDDAFEVWRHAALWDAVRKTSFRAVGQHEFGIALGYFRRLAGKEAAGSGAASRAGGWSGTNARIAERESGAEGDRRRAEWKLRKTCEEVKEAFNGDPEQALAYACVLLRTIHKTDLQHATGKQVWQVMFTLKSRAAARTNKQSLVIGQSSSGEKS
jgi:hypothetical protein